MRYKLLLLLTLLNTVVFADDLKGIVVSENLQRIENAIVTNKRTRKSVTCNQDGSFLLKGNSFGDTIIASHFGYVSERIVFSKGQSLVTIKLQSSPLELKDVTISSTLNHLSAISKIDLNLNPVQSSQELLRIVPGLVIGQHAGGGKAEQIFLRGFDIDHGTDININVDGMPVNMVSHAHGQGYADLHFLIPETVDKIDFDKGPYNADKGNLATAGYVSFVTKERLNESSLKTEAGSFNTLKTLGMFNLLNKERNAAYIAAEFVSTDGPFVSPQNFIRYNFAGKFTHYLKNGDKFSTGFTHFNSNWDASGQIPERAVKSGLISRFGAIDDTEGGNTNRTNFNVDYVHHFSDGASFSNKAFYSKYNFKLYSNFTFYLNNPTDGDQIRQKENRNLIGYQSEYKKNFQINNYNFAFKSGAGFRSDFIKNIELTNTANRTSNLNQIQLGNVTESNFYGYAAADIRKGKWLINPALRLDYINFNYLDKLSTNSGTLSQSKAILSPKFNVLYNINSNTSLFLKTGKGFHSNDTRVVVAQQGQSILPAAYGADLGVNFKPLPNLLVNAALWYLYLEQEFVYVGDEGVVEPSGKTQRYGFDVGMRYQLAKWLFLNSDLSYTLARSIDDPKDENYIPLAVPFTLTGGLNVKYNQFNGSLKARHIANRPANENYSLTAKGYTITDLNLNYTYKKLRLGMIIDNLFDVDWNETQFATESRLQNESQSVEEINFTPGAPFSLRLSLALLIGNRK